MNKILFFLLFIQFIFATNVKASSTTLFTISNKIKIQQNKTKINRADYEKQLGRKLNFKERIVWFLVNKRFNTEPKEKENVSIKTKFLIVLGASILIWILTIPAIGVLALILGFLFTVPKLKHKKEDDSKKRYEPIDKSPEAKAKRNNKRAIIIFGVLILLILLFLILSPLSGADFLKFLFR